MGNEIAIPASTIRNLEAIASSVFPMEIDAQLPIRDIGGNKTVVDINLRYDEVDPKAFIYSENFEKLISCLEHNEAPDFLIARLKKEYELAQEQFRKYGLCQRMRKQNECSREEVQTSLCSSCEAYNKTDIPGMYAWFDNVPSVAWHSRASTKYGDVEKLASPSNSDRLILARRIAYNQLPIEAEAITCVSETGEKRTKIYYPDRETIKTTNSDGRHYTGAQSFDRSRPILPGEFSNMSLN